VADRLIHFLDGPCDGTTRTVSQAVVDRGSVTCKSTLYVHYVAAAAGADIVFVPADSELGRAQTGADGTPAHVTQAWTRWMRALAHKGPHAHNRIQRATVRARRIARNR
jgi:hypothetical protein